MTELTYKANQFGTVQAAYLSTVRIGYIDMKDADRWIWTLNMIQPKGGRATGIVISEDKAKAALTDALIEWVDAAGLQFKPEQQA